MVFSSGVVSGAMVCLDLAILEDDIYEEDQFLNVSIVSVFPSSAAAFGTDSSIITIEDNEGNIVLSQSFYLPIYHISDAVVGFVMDGYNVNEGTGAVDICIDSGVTEGFQTDLTVSLSATSGTACEKIPIFLHFCV